jgi:hypothetical protein
MQKGVVGMTINPVMFAVVIGVFIGIAFGAGFAVADWRQAVEQKLSAGGEVWLAGYGTRNLKYGSVNHIGDYTRERADQFLRELNKESVYVKQGEPEYELVELFYRKVN